THTHTHTHTHTSSHLSVHVSADASHRKNSPTPDNTPKHRHDTRTARTDLSTTPQQGTPTHKKKTPSTHTREQTYNNATPSSHTHTHTHTNTPLLFALQESLGGPLLPVRA